MGTTQPPRAFVHIGTHKTGSTSLQYWLAQHAEDLVRDHGIGVYRPIHPNGRELALWCANSDRSIPTIREIPEWRTDAWRNQAYDHIRRETLRPDETLVFSNETLSLLRTTDELERLRDLLAPRRIEIIYVTRRREDFLRSWREQLTRDGFTPSTDQSSFAYLESNSWLVDYDDIVRVNTEVFGHDHVHHVDYDVALSRFGSVIPAVMDHVVDDITQIPEWATVRRNRGTRRHPNEPSWMERIANRLRTMTSN